MIEPDKASFPKNIRIGTMSSASVGEQLQFQGKATTRAQIYQACKHKIMLSAESIA